MGTIQVEDAKQRGTPSTEDKPNRVKRITDRLERAGDYATGSIALILTAIGFSLLGVHLEYAIGAFLLLNSHKIVTILKIVRGSPDPDKPSGVKEMLTGRR